MSIDVPTILLASILSSTTVAGVIALIWRQNPEMRALGWWSAAYILAACGAILLLLMPRLPTNLSFVAFNTVLDLSFALLWVGARVFNGRSPHAWALPLIGAFWLLVIQVLQVETSRAVLAGLSFGAAMLLTAGAGYELWREKTSEYLPTRIAAVLLLALHALAALVSGIGIVWGNAVPDPLIATSTWITVRVIEGYLFSIGLGVTLVALVKERAERLQHARAVTDPLTGVLNRRALFDEGEFLLRKAAEQKHPVSLILFDLDNFKSVNDQLGHQEGDKFLMMFARAAAAEMRRTDLFGRIGGDEFAAFVVGTEGEALMSAARVQATFRRRGVEAGPDTIGRMATVSAGVASRHLGESLASLLGRADRALYLAKHNGRDRVQAAPL